MRKLNLKKAAAKKATSKIEAANELHTSAIEQAPVIESTTEAASTDAGQTSKPVPVIAKHDITTAYAGPSKPFTSRKSRTAITAEFNVYANAALTDRDCAFLHGLKQTYGNAEFPRLNADAGNLRRAIERGYINYGEALNSFILTEKALTSRFA